MTTWGSCPGAVGTVYGSCPGDVGTEWGACGETCQPVVLPIPVQDVYWNSGAPGNTIHRTDFTGPTCELVTIRIEFELDTLGTGSEWQDTVIRFYWDGVDVTGQELTSFRLISDTGTGPTGPRVKELDISALSGDHLVEDGNWIDAQFYDDFNDASPAREAQLTNVVITYIFAAT